MRCRESAAAWRLFQLNWIPLGLMAATLALSTILTQFSLAIGGTVVSLAFVALYGGFAYYNAKAKNRRDPQVVFLLGSTAQIVLVTVLMTPLTYVVGAANFPLQDGNLLAIDRALGLDGRAYLEFVNARPELSAWLASGYAMIKWPIFAIPVILAATRRYVRLQEFALAFGLALIVTTIVSMFVPAFGIFAGLGVSGNAYPHINPLGYLDTFHELTRVREGSVHELDLFALAGIVTFPSFHAASAVLYTWALWPVWWARPVAVVCNGAMLAATPINGGHYFIDLAAGIAVAVLAIVAARKFSVWLVGRMASAPVMEAAEAGLPAPAK